MSQRFWDEYVMKIELIEPMLGTISKDQKLYTEYIKTKAPVQDPEESVEDIDPDKLEERGWTGFYVMGPNDERPALMDYQVKGFLKNAANIMKDAFTPKMKALKSHLENEVFVFPRRQPICELDELPLETLERPLRAMTAQGPRVSLVRSDICPAGKEFTFELKVLKDSRLTLEVLQDILTYGQMQGLGQWRGGGYGRFDGYIHTK